MPQSSTTSVATPDVVQDGEPTLVQDGTHASVLITEQEVVFSTAVALSSRPSKSRRLIDAIRVAGAVLRLPPPKRHLSHCDRYLEHSRMAREMDRL